MRKDVKLGMAIGGGLIVLLVGYLLLAPPSNNNKKGTQLAGGSAVNIIDSAGPGDLIGSDDKTAKPAGEPNNTGNTAGGNTATGGNSTGNLSGNRSGDNPSGGNPAGGNRSNGTADVRPTGAGAKASDTAKSTENLKPAVDQWGNALEKGKTAGTAAGSNPKETDHAKSGRHETGEGRAAPASSDSPKLLYNPNDAWGGGVSTDAVFGNGHTGKTDLTANSIAGKSGTGAVTEAVGESGGTHVVKSGETLSSIALSAYGSTTYYPHILRANPGINPNNLKLGTTLKLPHVSEVKADKVSSEHGEEYSATPAALEVKIDPSKQYRVQPGDSLYKISMKVYGKSTFVDKIYEKNKVAIGADNKRLKLGMILDLPEKTSTAAASPNDPTTSSLSDPATEENQPK